MARGREITVSAIQITAVDGEKDATVARMMDMLDIAGERGTQLCVLPEVWTGLGYSAEKLYREIAEPIPGPTTRLLAEKARKWGMYIVGSMYEDMGDGTYYNSSPFIAPSGEILGKYWKTHLFDAPKRVDIKGGIRESDKVRPGNELPVFDADMAKVGVSVCSDLRFPEVYRELMLKGAEIIVCASAFLSPRFDHWEFFLRARATENQTFVVASGQYGVEPKSGIGYVGRSMVVDPWGVIVGVASDTECVLTTTIDLDFIAEVRRRYPLIEQRRPELYQNIGKPKQAVAAASVQRR
ncbi:MAG: carbon-nitrogen hydrolase family protein [Candidatus Lambdaproteobacteria bacterium]|nr:carbon-nitrogen hydrolase family protein [Candidatus Lambdaproteobacteria bacterium]